MKIIVTIFNVLTGLYFFVMANFFFWISLVTLISVGMNGEATSTNPWGFLSNIILAPFQIYAAILFFRKSKVKYSYGLKLLFVSWIIALAYRFFFVSKYTLDATDLENLLFFGIPFIFIWFTKFLDKEKS